MKPRQKGAKMLEPTLHFYITEYEDGNLKIETKHIHYMFRNDLNFDDFEPNRLDEIINIITDVCRKEGITAYFTKN